MRRGALAVGCLLLILIGAVGGLHVSCCNYAAVIAAITSSLSGDISLDSGVYSSTAGCGTGAIYANALAGLTITGSISGRTVIDCGSIGLALSIASTASDHLISNIDFKNTRLSAITMVGSGSATVTGCTFTSSRNTLTGLGGALFVDSTSLLIQDSTFSQNSATTGAAVYVKASSGSPALSITGSTFSYNTAGGGVAVSGVVYAEKTTTYVYNSMFASNSASNGGAGLIVQLLNDLYNTTFTSSTGAGGVLLGYVDGSLTSAWGTIRNCNFSYSTNGFQSPTDTAALVVWGPNAVMTDCVFDSNYDSLWLVYSIGQKTEAHRVTMTNNRNNHWMWYLYSPCAMSILDGLYVKGNTVIGNVIFATFGNSPTIVNSIFIGNMGGGDGLIYQPYGLIGYVTNCTLIANSAVHGLLASPVANSYFEIRNSTFTSNTGTDGVYYALSQEAMLMTGCTLTNNVATTGAAFSLLQATITVSGSTFINNTAASGGVLYSVESSSTFTDCVFSGNSATGSGGVVFMSGTGTLSITGGSMSGNSAQQAGGAVFGFFGTSISLSSAAISANSASLGGAIYVDTIALQLASSTLTSNTAGQGGAVYMANAVVATIASTNFTSNYGLNAGALYVSDGSAVITSCFFTSNSAALDGGAAYLATNTTISKSSFISNSAGQYGGGLSLQQRTPFSGNTLTFTHNSASYGGAFAGSIQAQGNINKATITNNTAQQGGGIYWAANNDLMCGGCDITFNKASGNGGGVYMNSNANVRLFGNNVLNNTATGSGGGVYTGGGGLSTNMNVKFTGNVALTGAGGGVYSTRGGADLKQTTFTANTAATGGGALACGGCMLAFDPSSKIVANRAVSGGALWCDPMGIYLGAANIPSMMTITGNVGTSEPLVQANCTACGCCGFDAPTFLVAQASPCMPSAGRACKYTCSVGYNISQPNAMSTCAAGGVPSNVTCPAIACPVLGDLPFGATTYTTTGTPVTGTVAKFNCSEGYTRNGIDSTTCVGPNWIGYTALPLCLPNTCSNLTAPENGYVDRTCGVTGDVATYTCKQGYTLPNGAAFVNTTCLVTWTVAKPGCERGQCPALGALANGKLAVQGRLTDDIVIFTCNDGYLLVGAPVIRCLSPAWNDSSPICEAIPCSLLDDPANGVIFPKNGSTGSSVAITCDTGYQLDGTVSPTCLGPDWQYPDGIPACNIASCPIPGSPYNISQCEQPLVAGSYCHVACEDGYRGSEFSVMCQQNQINARGRLIQVNSTLTQFPVCAICEAGRYSKSGDTRCTLCVNGYTPQEGSNNITQCLCNLGYWQVPGTGVCQDCPPGGLCLGNLEQPIANVGYFYSGGQYIACSPAVACTANNTCLEGYTGYTCGLCVEGYYRLAGQCTKCQSSTDWRLTAAIVGMGLALLLLIPVAKPSSSSELSINFASVNIFVNFVQITSTFTYFRLPWGTQITAVFNVMSVFNLNIELASPECVVRINFYDKMNTILLIPVAVAFIYLIALAIYLGVLYAWKYRHRPLQHFKARAKAAALDWVGGFLLFLTLLYLYLARTSLSLFSCKTQLDGVHVLTLSPADECFTEAWRHQIPVAIIGLIVYVFGIPAGMLYLGWVMRARYGPGSAASNQPSSFFVKKYEQGSWFWEMVIMLRKLFIVCVVLFLVDNTIVAVILACGMLFVMCVLTALLQPYLWDGHDLLDFLALLGSLAILFSGLVVNAPSFSAQLVADVVAVILVVLTGVVCLLCFIFELQMNLRLRLLTRKIVQPTVNRRVHDHRRVTGIQPAFFVGAHQMCVFTAAEDGHIAQWHGKELETEDVSFKNDEPITHMAVVARTLVAQLEGEEHLRMFDVETMDSLGEISVGAATTCMHAESGHMVVATKDGHVIVYGAHGSGRVARTLSASLSTSDGSDDEAAARKKILTPSLTIVTDHHFVAVRVTPLYVFGCIEDGLVMQWLLETGALLQEWRIKAELTTLELFGSLMCVGAADGLIRIIDTKTNEVHELSGHTGAVTCMAISAGRLASASADHTLRLWNLETHDSVLALLSPTLGFSHVAFAGDMLVAGTDDGLLLAYDITQLPELKKPDGTGPCIRRLCRKADDDRQIRTTHTEWDEAEQGLLVEELRDRVHSVHTHRHEEKLVLATLLDELAHLEHHPDRQAPGHSGGSGAVSGSSLMGSHHTASTTVSGSHSALRSSHLISGNTMTTTLSMSQSSR